MAFEELKSKQSAMWGNGPYQNITETLTDLHELVIDRLAPAEGVTWLDLACGTGAMAELATKRGSDVRWGNRARGFSARTPGSRR